MVTTPETARSTSSPPPPAGGGLEVGLAMRGSLRWVAADLTFALEEARARLDLSPIASVALGRTLAAAALLRRIFLKTPSRVLVEVRGDGPLGPITGEASEGGHLRGSVGNPQVAVPADGDMRIAALVGRGRLRVTRELQGSRYSSEVELVSGELGDDLTHYLEQSEQIRSAVLLGVLPRPAGIAAAGGLIVEALPGTDGEVIEQLEANIRALEGVSAVLEHGGSGALAGAVLAELEPELLETRPLEYRCRCDRETLRLQLQSIARDDIDSLLREDGTCEAVCAFCAESYVFTAGGLTANRA